MSNRHHPRTAAAAITTLLAALTLPLLPAPPASALNLITVTTTADVIDSEDGLTSLREAVDLANTTPDATEIVLAPGASYTLTLCPVEPEADDDVNAVGDLDLTSPYDVTIAGNDATITQTCSGSRHIDWIPTSGTPLLTIADTSLTGGSHIGYGASSIAAISALTLDRVTVTGNAQWGECGDQGAVMATGTGSLTVIDSTISATVNGAGIVDNATGGTFTISGSTISDNEGNCFVAGVAAQTRPVTITSSIIRDNRSPSAVPPDGTWTDPDSLGDVDNEHGAVFGIDVTVIDTLLERNAGAYGGAIYAEAVRAENSTFRHNGSFVAGAVQMHAGSITDSSFVENSGGLLGGALLLASCLSGTCPPDPTVISNSTFNGNLASSGGGIVIEETDGPDGTPTVIRRSTISGNRSYAGVGLVLIDVQTPVTLAESTVSDNHPADFLGTIAEPFNGVAVTGSASPTPNALTIRNSVIHEPDSALSNCLFGMPLVSEGHNFESDGTCSLTDPTDVSNGADPMLGGLADNGGVTETMVPLPGSPLLDAVPVSAAGCAGETSQNALVLPQGLGCEIGAAEVPSTARLAGHVTSAYTGLPLSGVEVRVRSTANVNVATTTTGPDGTWAVAGLATGDYKVLFRDPTGEHNQTFNGSAWPFSAAPAVTVNATNTTVVDQALTVDNTLTGTVTDTQTGLPVAGVQVRVRTAANTYIRTATTNAAGVYTITDLTPGDYKLLFRDPTGAHEQTFNGSTWPFSAAPPITVTTGTVTIDQALVPVPAITGTVTEEGTGTPLAGIEIRVRTLANTYLGSTTTAPDGTWRIHLPAGTYKLLYTDPTSTHTAEWHDNKPGFATATPITHTPTGTTLTATLTPAP